MSLENLIEVVIKSIEKEKNCSYAGLGFNNGELCVVFKNQENYESYPAKELARIAKELEED